LLIQWSCIRKYWWDTNKNSFE